MNGTILHTVIIILYVGGRRCSRNLNASPIFELYYQAVVCSRSFILHLFVHALLIGRRTGVLSQELFRVGQIIHVQQVNAVVTQFAPEVR